jgi:hypothetical protein
MEALAIWWKPFGSTLRIITLKARISANAAHATARHIPEWAAHHRRQEFDVIPGVALGTGPNGRIRRDAVQRSERARHDAGRPGTATGCSEYPVERI